MNLEEISQNILAATKKTVLSSSKLPNPGTEYSLNLSVPAVRNNLNEKRGEVMSAIEGMLRFLNAKVPLSALSDSSQCQDDAEVQDFLDILIDANDQVFEHVGEALDIASGLKKDAPELVIVNAPRHRFKKPGETAPSTSANGGNNISKAGERSAAEQQKPDVFRLIAARIVERPQVKFSEKIDNSNSIFVPKLRFKPNALRPLEESLFRLEDGEGSYQNPYSFELQSLEVNEEFITPSSYGPPKSLEETPLVHVENPDQFSSMIKDLSLVSELAVDLEHHSYRTFQGFTCLIQISTRSKDYVVDALSLRSRIQDLLPIFTNPNVLKVFHGADSDISWLQRDFGVYVVNMFDTFRAAKSLSFPKLSLAYLLERYLQIEVDKRFQLADWRIRPLPEELIKYARSDTHYLLHVCDLMKNDLIERAKYEGTSDQFCLVRRVFDESSTVCATHYEKTIFTDESHLELYERSRKVFNSQQLTALKLLFTWRNKIARREDESTGYVLPNHMLLQMAELLPKEPTGVLACCQPIPPLVKQNVHEMHGFILQARRQPLTQVENPAVAAAKTHFTSMQKISPELEALSCPLDPSAKLPSEYEERLEIVVEVISASKKKTKKKSSTSSPFLAILLPEAHKFTAKEALMRQTLSLFAGYALKSQDFPQSERKPGLVLPTSSSPENESTPQPRRLPLKRPATDPPNLHLQPISGASYSSSPAKRSRKSPRVKLEATPLVPPAMPQRRRKRGPKFVEKVVDLTQEDGEIEEEQTSAKKRQNQHTRRRDFHERNSRQMKAFSSPGKKSGRGGK